MKKSRPRNKGRPTKKKPAGLTFHQHPFAGVDRDVLRQAFAKLADRAVADFDEHVSVLEGLFRRCFPPQVISTVAGYALVGTVSAGGAPARSMMPEIQQHHVELLQALALRIPRNAWGLRPAIPEDIQTAIDAAKAVTDAFFHRRFKALEEEADAQARTVVTLQERLRGHTQMVRNWGYYSDVVRISKELFGGLDRELFARRGFSASDLIDVASELLRIVEERQNARFAALRKAFRGGSTAQIVRRYYAAFTDVQGDPEEFIRGIPHGAPREAVVARLLAHADLQFATMAMAPIPELASRTGRDEEVVRSVLAALSMVPGALEQVDPSHLLMANPVWTAPAMELGGDYFVPMPQVVFSHIHAIMRGLCEASGLKTKLEERRATYLEAKVRELIGKGLPTAKIQTNAKWAGFETDVLAQVDRLILIVEAKSAALTPQGLRGAPERVRRHIRDLIVSPSEQSARLESILWEAKGGKTDARAVTDTLGLEVDNVDTVVRLSVTLDDFSIISSAEGDLKAAGWVPDHLALAPTVNLSDLGCIVDILDEPVFLLHYLAERGRMQRAVDLVGDELDMLGLYLESGFNVGNLEEGEYRLAISGMSEAVDHYYTSRDAGVRVRKPRPKCHPYLLSVLRQLQDRQPSAWTTMALDILRACSPDEQRQLVNATEKLRRSVTKDYRDPAHKSSIVMVPRESREGLVLVYVYPEQLADKRREAVEVLTAEVMEENGRKRCVFIGRKIEEWSRPYQFIGLATQPDEEPSALAIAQSGELK